MFAQISNNTTASSSATTTSITQMPPGWQSIVSAPGTDLAEYLNRLPSQTLPLSLHHFLKFSAETIKRESLVESSPLCGSISETHILPDNNIQEEQETQEGEYTSDYR